MGKLVEGIKSAWDWPLSSEFARSSDEQASLRRASETGSILGGIGSAGIIYIFELSAAPAAALASASVLAGYYAGSAAWRSVKGTRFIDHTLNR